MKNFPPELKMCKSDMIMFTTIHIINSIHVHYDSLHLTRHYYVSFFIRLQTNLLFVAKEYVEHFLCFL